MTDPTNTGDLRDTIAIVHEPDGDGWLISATVGGAVFSVPGRRRGRTAGPHVTRAAGTVRVGMGPRPTAGTGCSPPGARCGWSSASSAPGWSSSEARPSASACT